MKSSSMIGVIEQLRDYDRFLITGHQNPDGDSIGSILAIYFILNQLGKESRIIMPDSVPTDFSFLPQVDRIQSYQADLSVTDCEAVVVVDSGSYDRIGRVADLIAQQPIINLDHHPDNTYFGDYNLVDKKAAATTELLYLLQEELSQVDLTEALAEALATGLITDTGSFRYSNVSSTTHRIMADLLAVGVDSAYLSRQIMGSNSYQSLLLRGAVLSDLEVAAGGRLAWITVTQQLLDRVGATKEATEGLVGYPRSLEGAEVGILFREEASDEIKVSLRSNSYLAVNQIAHQFGGGGHSRAAGCLIDAPLEVARKQVITAVKEKLAESESEEV